MSVNACGHVHQITNSDASNYLLCSVFAIIQISQETQLFMDLGQLTPYLFFDFEVPFIVFLSVVVVYVSYETRQSYRKSSLTTGHLFELMEKVN